MNLETLRLKAAGIAAAPGVAAGGTGVGSSGRGRADSLILTERKAIEASNSNLNLSRLEPPKSLTFTTLRSP